MWLEPALAHEERGEIPFARHDRHLLLVPNPLFVTVLDLAWIVMDGLSDMPEMETHIGTRIVDAPDEALGSLSPTENQGVSLI